MEFLARQPTNWLQEQVLIGQPNGDATSLEMFHKETMKLLAES
jgi:hypothetical protein